MDQGRIFTADEIKSKAKVAVVGNTVIKDLLMGMFRVLWVKR